MAGNLTVGADELAVRPFEPELHRAPSEVFRRFVDGTPPSIFDLGSGDTTLAGAEPVRADDLEGRIQETPPGEEILLIDDDGKSATAAARCLRRDGSHQVYALYGGLRLYRFALDPLVVGEERFLRPRTNR